VAAGGDPVAFLEKYPDRVIAIHLKDRKKNQGPNMPWGQGDTPIRRVLSMLKAKRSGIPANIEYAYPGADTVAEVRRCFEYCRTALA
jgi:sugar phosphate isomerase/epimerase